VMLLAGFLKPWLLRRERLVTSDEACFYRQTLQQRMWRTFASGFGRFVLKLSTVVRI
jgi:hypothetical protein